jgi:hypothetical protein
MELVQRIDEYGKPAWITLMVLSFIIFWPIGLAVLFYMIWSGRMGCSKRKRHRMHMWSRDNGSSPADGISSAMRAWKRHAPASGNRAFDEYRAETMRRLEEEFDEFQDFLGQLRAARDKKEFDRFMDSRGKSVDSGGHMPVKGKSGKKGGEQPAA